jgi:peptidylprolyl isomerase
MTWWLRSAALALCAAAVLAGCGGGSDGGGPVADRETKKTTTSTTPPKQVRSANGKPIVQPPGVPPPKDLVINDLRLGKGPAAGEGDEVTINYVGADYATGTEYWSAWGSETLTFTLGTSTQAIGLEEGLEGMKVKGRRELVMPSSYAYGTGAMIYIVDLLRVKLGSTGSA